MEGMGPLNLRRYRAERLLREQFDALRAVVLANARRRLRASGAAVERLDLEACYAQAWQGLYAVVLEGEEVSNPAGWLTLVTFRRALDEHRSHDAMSWAFELDAPAVGDEVAAASPDVTEALDDRRKLRELMEGLRLHLSEREREAAALCYLQGLSRSQAAAQMGVRERTLRRLMEGRGRGKPGVASKLAALSKTISEGRFCDEQASLMRAYAFGTLSFGGERDRIARAHLDQCSSCRAYVRALRGLASVLPPVLLPGPLAAAPAGRRALRASTRVRRGLAAKSRGRKANASRLTSTPGDPADAAHGLRAGASRLTAKAGGLTAKARGTTALRLGALMRVGASAFKAMSVKTATMSLLAAAVLAGTGVILALHAAGRPPARGRRVPHAVSHTAGGAAPRAAGGHRRGRRAGVAKTRPRTRLNASHPGRRPQRESAGRRRRRRRAASLAKARSPSALEPQEFAIERRAPRTSAGVKPATRTALREFGGE